MSKRSKLTAEEKYQVLKEYEDGLGSIDQIVAKHKIAYSTFNIWRYNYKKYGIEGLKEARTCKRYSQEVIFKAVTDYFSGEFSQNEIIRKYEIRDRTVLLNWVAKYNSHRELNARSKGRSHSMTKGRKTSWKERIAIVLFCITHNYDYHKAAKTYEVSYQQAYDWVRKYESGGENALKDGRGRRKDEEELTPEEKLKIKMQRLEADNERLRAENAFLKKLEELERGR